MSQKREGKISYVKERKLKPQQEEDLDLQKDPVIEAFFLQKLNYKLQTQYLSNVGILKAIWLMPHNIQESSYGTAFAVSKRVIITCGHNIFWQKTRKTCDKIFFIPKVQRSKITDDMVYRNSENNFLQFTIPGQSQSFTDFVSPRDLALIYLSKDLDIEDFPIVGTGHMNNTMQQQRIMCSGFPSEEKIAKNLNEITFERKSSEGIVIRLDDFVLIHNLETEEGMSGSGISADIDAEQTLIGIHTHGSKQKNVNGVGIYFTNSILDKLIRFEINIGKKHKSYPMDIRFYGGIKEEAVRKLQNGSIKDHLLKRVQAFNQKRELIDKGRKRVEKIEMTAQKMSQQFLEKYKSKTNPLTNQYQTPLVRKIQSPGQRIQEAQCEENKTMYYSQYVINKKKNQKKGQDVKPPSDIKYLKSFLKQQSSSKMESICPKTQPQPQEPLSSDSELTENSDLQKQEEEPSSTPLLEAIKLSDLIENHEKPEDTHKQQ